MTTTQFLTPPGHVKQGPSDLGQHGTLNGL
jgi:hypothetical protein